MLSPKKFASQWKKDGDRLVRFPEKCLERLAMADADKEFLAQAGLPESAAPFLGFTVPAAGELPTVAKSFGQPKEFARYRIIGSDGEGSPIAIDEKNAGEVVCLDHEEDFARAFMNTTIRQMAESLLAYRDLVSPSDLDQETGEVSAKARQQVFQRIKKIDPAAVQPGCFWSNELKIANEPEGYPSKILHELVGPDAKLRLKASRHLQSELRKGSSKQRKELFGNLQATTPLIAALDDPAPEVVRNATIALAMIAANYFLDDRAYAKVIRLLRSKDVMTQSWAVSAAIRLRGQDSLDDVLPLCKDRSPIVCNRVLFELFRWLMETKPAKLQSKSVERLQKTALHHLNGSDAEMRGNAAYLLGQLGNDTAIAAMQARLKQERNRDAKQSIEEALAMAKKQK